MATAKLRLLHGEDLDNPRVKKCMFGKSMCKVCGRGSRVDIIKIVPNSWHVELERGG